MFYFGTYEDTKLVISIISILCAFFIIAKTMQGKNK